MVYIKNKIQTRVYYSNSFNVYSINHSASSEIILMVGFVGGYTLLVFARIRKIDNHPR
jgi:hypothetical protein